jgi:toxin-antitoxin system PIN domain toxin
VHLLDVNALLALLWPRHESHSSAQAWFAKTGHRGWATNLITQLGVVRLLTTPAVTQGAVNPSTALQVLNQATRHSGHAFWPLDRQLADSLSGFASRLQGHRQWSDAVLLSQVIARQAVLVTFDSGVKELVTRELARSILLLK